MAPTRGGTSANVGATKGIQREICFGGLGLRGFLWGLGER
ncbi:hypothetical protein BVRB_1g011820 [Beta vulgaris subsp. vulgaris]|nr:hypothetical protein BVRB_1g011820 [Beta vulgaris subsp. vulgaris]